MKSTSSTSIKTIYLATKNPHKVEEVERLIQKTSSKDLIKIVSTETLPDFDWHETAETFAGNAAIKAQAVAEVMRQVGMEGAVLADDSGLEVEALNGAPGVYSARYSGPHATDLDNRTFLIEQLQNLQTQRTHMEDFKPSASLYYPARFVCHLHYLDNEGLITTFEEYCSGRVSLQSVGQKGFGYDPIFIPKEATDGRTMAQLNGSEKDQISHRGKALRAWLKNSFGNA